MDETHLVFRFFAAFPPTGSLNTESSEVMESIKRRLLRFAGASDAGAAAVVESDMVYLRARRVSKQSEGQRVRGERERQKGVVPMG